MDKGLLLEYESLLLGKKHTISPFFMEGSPESAERKAMDIIRYAFSTYKKDWDIYTLRDCITPELIKNLQLRSFVKCVKFPPELNSETDLFYLVWKLYPKCIHITREELTIKVYKSLLSGEIQRFPKEFFSGANGMTRAEICLRYMIEQYLAEESVESLYKLFSSSKITTILREYRLLVASSDLFATPLEYFHTALSDKQKNETLYRFYQFANEFSKSKEA